MKRIAILAAAIIFGLCLAYSGDAQTVSPCPEMPPGYLCMTRAAVQQGLEAGDKARALQTQLDATEKALSDEKQLLNDMKVQFAEISGESTILKQRAVSDAAMIQLLLQNVKKKRNAFITIF